MCTQADLLSQMLLQVLKFEELGEETVSSADKQNSCSAATPNSTNQTTDIYKLTSLLRANLEELSLQVLLNQQQSQIEKSPCQEQVNSKVQLALCSADDDGKNHVSKKKTALSKTAFSSVDQLLQCINDLSIKSNGLAIDTTRRLSSLLFSVAPSNSIHSNSSSTSLLAIQRNLFREQANPLLYALAGQLRLYATLYYAKCPSYPNSSTLLLAIARLLNELLMNRSNDSPIEGVRLNEAVLYNLLESLLPYMAVYEQGLRMEHFRADCFLLRNVFTSLVNGFSSESASSLISFTDAETLLLVVLQMLVNLTQAVSFATQPGLLLYKHYQISPQLLESTVIRQLTILLRAVFGRYIRTARPGDDGDEGLADLDLVLLKVHRLLDLCYYIVKGHDKEFYYMAECIEEIESALGRIVEKVGKERFCACLAPIEEEVARSGRDARVVPIYDLLGSLNIDCVSAILPPSLKKLQKRAMVVLFRVIQVAVAWRRSRRFSTGGGEVSRAKKIKALMRRALT